MGLLVRAILRMVAMEWDPTVWVAMGAGPANLLWMVVAAVVERDPTVWMVKEVRGRATADSRAMDSANRARVKDIRVWVVTERPMTGREKKAACLAMVQEQGEAACRARACRPSPARLVCLAKLADLACQASPANLPQFLRVTGKAGKVRRNFWGRGGGPVKKPGHLPEATPTSQGSKPSLRGHLPLKCHRLPWAPASSC